MTPFLIRGDDADITAPIGGKARALAALRGLPIPPWFAVPPGRESPPQAELDEALREICPNGQLVAVRSSAADEDGADHSFAGQLDSFLSVTHADVPNQIEAVRRSGDSERVRAYRRERGLDETPSPPAVLIQRMVNADAAGVAFGADPVSGRHGIAVVAAVVGLGTSLVSGDDDADTFHIDRAGGIVSRTLADERPAITDEQAREVAALVRLAGAHFGRPQDIEWAIEGGELYLLQSRPITSLADTPDPDGARQLWDNSNIAESYNGVTTPLTFSFANRVYEAVYLHFCRILRVPEAVLERNDDLFPRMLGLIRGRVYYNLLNWYRLIALLPGFQSNRAFMEQMMGVKEGLPDDIAGALVETTWLGRWRDRLRLAKSVIAIVRNHWSMDRQIRRFHERLLDALGETPPDLAAMRPDELVAHYRDLERKLLRRWDAPLVNDFLAMIFHGVLGKLVKKWGKDEAGTLHNDLLCGEGGMISAEPATRVRALAEIASRDAKLLDALCDAAQSAALRGAEAAPEFAAAFHGYLDKFGDRCLEELKLESPTLHDDPTTLLRSAGHLGRRIAKGDAPKPTGDDRVRRDAAEASVRSAIGFRPLRRLIFRWVLRNARARVRDRENLRFERTRLFGRVRRIVVELGRRFHAAGRLDSPRDAFYLELDELLAFVDGTATCTDLRGLVALRRAEFKRYREEPAPADRFETFGTVYVGHRFEATTPRAPDPGGDARTGLGCCPGVVRGIARVVTDPRHAELTPGDILVAERTDPGWIVLFPSAAGLIVERGSLLSHSAIVSREMGIPSVVALAGATRWIRSGDVVELDGTTGIVRKIEGQSV